MANRTGNSESEMVGGNCDSAPVKEKKSLTNIESLPSELMFDILLQLSVKDIYNGAMLVSREWYNLIRSHDFIHAHLQRSTPGLLVLKFYREEKHSVFVAIQQGRIDVSKFPYMIGPNRRWNSCNGLILEYDTFKQPLRLINPAINRIFEIPPFYWEKAKHHWWGVAYSAASKEYKVVHTYQFTKDQNLRCAIVTIGVDKFWRDVCTEHLPPAKKNILCNNPIMTEGFFHCIEQTNSYHILTLNVETETITVNPIPQVINPAHKWTFHLSTGKSLSMFIRCGRLCLEGWEMKSETGEWTKMYMIDLFAHKFELGEACGTKFFNPKLMPVGWLKYQEVLVLRFGCPSPVCIAYNVRTHKSDPFELDGDPYTYIFQVHTNSLVGLV